MVQQKTLLFIGGFPIVLQIPNVDWTYVCSNDAFPFWTSKMLQKALSNERDAVKKIHQGFGRKQYGYSCGSLALQSPGGSSVAMVKRFIGDFSIALQIPNMDWKYVQMMHSLSVHAKSYTGRCLMIEMRSMVGHSMDIVVAPWLCNPLEAAQ